MSKIGIILLFAILNISYLVEAKDTKVKSNKISDFSSFSVKAIKTDANFSFGRYGFYATPKAGVNIQFVKNLINQKGMGYFTVDFKRNQLDFLEKENMKTCKNANYKAKNIDLKLYLRNTYQITLQQLEKALSINLNKSNQATLVKFSCPTINWPSYFLVLQSKQYIEKHGLSTGAMILLDYKGVITPAIVGIML